ncbi:superoxide dismutase[Cu-Zn] [Acetobacter fallax]|uniref:Superoxide dismutase family protein n=1 Tax=Acetobacter fallax TaxID=1737473 RepID=A0ABX0K5V2_9PROT|nr:superoxide dismutase family protein [Acetobacter fallax]NHO31762.1 superoxide dismutase family protein [Acetobacter fallax]NHO35321.1 superoxide dismutase family protein [Acetobacter fallax]
MISVRLMLMTGFMYGIATLPAFAAAAGSASGELIGADGGSRGTVQVTGAPKGVLVRIMTKGLPPGWHGVHFHEKGDCTAPKFTTAGGHVHTAKPVVHGLMHAEANDDGDLPNIFIGPDGAGTVELYSTLVSLSEAGRRPALLDSDGSSLVIHASPDDYRTQPIGGAGDRIACAVLH